MKGELVNCRSTDQVVPGPGAMRSLPALSRKGVHGQWIARTFSSTGWLSPSVRWAYLSLVPLNIEDCLPWSESRLFQYIPM